MRRAAASGSATTATATAANRVAVFRLVTVKGEHARIERGYFVAADIGAYQLAHADGEWSLSGVVLKSDPFQLRQRPLLFFAPYRTHDGRQCEWLFTVDGFYVAEGRVHARLLPLR